MGKKPSAGKTAKKPGKPAAKRAEVADVNLIEILTPPEAPNLYRQEKCWPTWENDTAIAENHDPQASSANITEVSVTEPGSIIESGNGTEHSGTGRSGMEHGGMAQGRATQGTVAARSTVAARGPAT